MIAALLTLQLLALLWIILSTARVTLNPFHDDQTFYLEDHALALLLLEDVPSDDPHAHRLQRGLAIFSSPIATCRFRRGFRCCR